MSTRNITLYNRQPFADGLTPADVQTREEIANQEYGDDMGDLSLDTRLEIEQKYHEQFNGEGGESDD
ncbi:hypothetical protein [Halorubrum depositum]|uniref:hypothetical protein n=1 Tax=Halorubrum depositum TaxID=2583992 RepID=UPI0011A6B107|nr:hypothetical protein [Halorubrum depositum]